MQRLNRALFSSGYEAPAGLAVGSLQARPERILQFGEGNFLRGFVDWMVHRANEHGLYDGSAVVVQGMPEGQGGALNAQDGLYTLLMRGVQNGVVSEEKTVISSVSRSINPYTDFEAVLQCAENPLLRFVVSNTTEAGIAQVPGDRPGDMPPSGFPAKLAAVLLRRFVTFGGDPKMGLVMLPCELIERNGDNLRRIVLQLAWEWGLDPAFIRWVRECCIFTNTLVDRIVTGYPADEMERITPALGYRDGLVVAGEPFHLWVIEGGCGLEDELPLQKAGLNVVWTDDITPYRDRKVRILNGAHTITVMAAYLSGLNTVKECLDSALFLRYMEKGIFGEILPTLDLPEEELQAYASAVLERFANPFIRHRLLSITLNSISKYKARVLPSLLEYRKRTGELPTVLTFSLAALVRFYRGERDAKTGMRGVENYPIADDGGNLAFMHGAWLAHGGDWPALAGAVLGNAEFWGMDLNTVAGLAGAVAGWLAVIEEQGIAGAVRMAAR